MERCRSYSSSLSPERAASQRRASTRIRALLVGAMLVAAAPYFSLARRAWIPCVARSDVETGEFIRTEGPSGFQTWQEAKEASRFLARSGGRGRPLTSAGCPSSTPQL